jgi:hypothetical protein
VIGISECLRDFLDKFPFARQTWCPNTST